LGVRARWWLFNQESATSAVSDSNTRIISAAPAGLSIESPQTTTSGLIQILNFGNTPMFVNSTLRLEVWDFEATGEAEVGRWALLFSGGFRYAHLSQNYNAFQISRRGFNPLGGLFIPSFNFQQTDLLSSGHNFNGAGPTVGLEAKRPLGNSGLALFANLRGAMLFGRSKLEVDQSTSTPGFVLGVPGVIATAASVRDTVLPVAELEMGAEFSRTWGAVRPFIRTGLLAQTWFDAGSASRMDGNLGFLGLSVTAGLNY
jgi:hypothetical protein